MSTIISGDGTITGLTSTGISAAQTVTSVPSSALPAGTVKQVQSSVLTTSFSVSATSGTFYDTGLSVTITPQSTTSKILVICDLNAYQSGNYALAQIARNGNPIYLNTSSPTFTSLIMPYPIYSQGPWGFRTAVFLDSPASTSAQTYKYQVSQSSGTATVYVNTRSDNAIGVPCSITVMEISGS